MKRFFAGVLVFCMTLALCLPPMRVSAAGAPVVFTVIDDIFTRNLTTASMPARVGEIMYVSHLYLLRLDELHYKRAEDSLTVYDENRGLIYDLRNSRVTDLGGQPRPMAPAILRNGSVYIPVEELCSYFGLYCSIIRSSGLGEIIRIDRQKPVVADSVIVSANIEVLRQIYVDYQMTVALEEQNKPKPEPEPEPEPGPDPGPEPRPEPKPEPKPPDRWLYLFFEVTPDAVGEVPELLEQKRITATFFVRPADILDCGEFLRSAVMSGHGLGLILEPGEDLKQQMEQGNRLLFSVCLQTTRLVHVPGVEEETRRSLTREGWRFWSWTRDSRFDELSVASSVIHTMAELDSVRERAVLRLGCTDAAYQSLVPILYYAESKNYRYLTIRLWTEPLV